MVRLNEAEIATLMDEVAQAGADRAAAAAAVKRLYRVLWLPVPRVVHARSIREGVLEMFGGRERLLKRCVQRQFRPHGRTRDSNGVRPALRECIDQIETLWNRLSELPYFEHLNETIPESLRHLGACAALQAEAVARECWTTMLTAEHRARCHLNGGGPASTLGSLMGNTATLLANRTYRSEDTWHDAWQRVLLMECLLRPRPTLVSEREREFVGALFATLGSIHAAVLSTDLAIVVDSPDSVVLDESRLPHNLRGPAVRLRDGQELFAISGCWVPRATVEEPGKLTLEEVELENSPDIKAVLIERYGLGRYLDQTGAVVIGEDRWGTLLFRAQHNADPLVAVRVSDSTPGPDGVRQTYVLRVPPEMTSPREAVAWTFGMTMDEYGPKVET